jgi:hypothetical protein
MRYVIRRAAYALVLGLYGVATLAFPLLHQRHHARFGADHVHGPDGTVYLHQSAADHHAAFDADLASLELGDVAHAGVVLIDCTLAEFTLASCDDARPDHPQTFGDQLLANTQHKSEAPDLEHGKHSLEHLGVSLVGTPTFLLTPPALPTSRLAWAAPLESRRVATRTVYDSRGPPELF